MSSSELPARPSLEYLKKLAKERLRELRASKPETRLAAAQLAVARDHGFSSWRALKAEVDHRRAPAKQAYFAACREGDAAALLTLLTADPGIVAERDEAGGGGLHLAVAHPACLRLLLEHGADPSLRDRGDHATALHFAAGEGQLESVRVLLDAGADPVGHGDLHESDVIGWAVWDGAAVPREIVSLLLARGAEHNIFSAVGAGDADAVRALVARDPAALARRRSRFEQGQTPLHFALAAPDGRRAKAPQHDMLRLLLELGADVEARDDRGRTPLALAMLRGDVEGMRLLQAAGARAPEQPAEPAPATGPDSFAEVMNRPVRPMLCVEDVDETVAWYRSLGFELEARYPETGPMNWAALSFGRKVELMVQGRGGRPRGEVALWFRCARIDDLYRRLREQQMSTARALLAGESASRPAFDFLEDLHEPFHGGRQFSLRDPDGIELVFQTD